MYNQHCGNWQCSLDAENKAESLCHFPLNALYKNSCFIFTILFSDSKIDNPNIIITIHLDKETIVQVA